MHIQQVEIYPLYIELKARDLPLLKSIQDFFGVGKIYEVKNSKKHHFTYMVRSVKDLHAVIIPFFVKYPMLSSKNLSFLLFKDVVEIIIKKEHLTPEGVRKIMCIRASMNHGVSTILKRSTTEISNIQPVLLPSLPKVKGDQINKD